MGRCRNANGLSIPELLQRQMRARQRWALCSDVHHHSGERDQTQKSWRDYLAAMAGKLLSDISALAGA